MKKIGLFVLMGFVAVSVEAAVVTLTFDNSQLPADRQLRSDRYEFWNGTTRNAQQTSYDASYNPTYGAVAAYATGGTDAGNAVPLAVGGAHFSNHATWDSTNKYWGWYGFGVSNAKNTTATKGWGGNLGNEMVSWAENSGDAANQYLIGYWANYDYIQNQTLSDPCEVTFGQSVTPLSVDISNTTWTAAGMGLGDGFTNPMMVGDRLLLEITGTSAGTPSAEKVTVDLGYKTAAETFILDDWTNVDLSSLGEVDKLSFHLAYEAEDYGGILGEWGLNVATYFALDNLKYQTAAGPTPAGVPEPATWVLLGGLLFFFCKKGRVKK